MKQKIYTIKAVAVDLGLTEANVPCGDCNVCCTKLSPFLTPEEFESGRYMYTFISTVGGPAIAVPRKAEGGCYYLDRDGKCSIYDDRPRSCRVFDCRLGHHPNIPNQFEGTEQDLT